MSDMKLYNKKIQVQHDPVNDDFTVSVTTDLDGTIWSQKAETLKDVLYLIGQITKNKIDYIQ